MIDHKGKNLVFLLCVPRSGSSLTTTMIQNHNQVFAAQEMWFLMSLYDLRKAQPRPYGGSIIVDRFFNGLLTDDLFEQACREFAMQVYNGLLQTSRGAHLVVDKSPRYYYLLEFLDRLFPKSQRIWLLRSPLGIVSSYKKVNQYNNSRFNVIEDLLKPEFNINMVDITLGLFRYYQYFSLQNPYAYLLYYEKLVSNPKEELEKLCGFLGIDYEAGLEKYGEHAHTSKGTMYTSMGVGDPFLFRYNEPHLESLNSWKEILDKKEVEMYCRVLGARIFHELGYSEQLTEAEKWTGVRFDMEPNMDLIQLRAKQLQDLTGCKWEEGYQMKSEMKDASQFFNKNDLLPEKSAEMMGSFNPEVLQLQISLRSLEKRLEKSYNEQNHLRSQLLSTRDKLDRIKSMIPFSNHISNWASRFLLQGGRGK